MSSAIKGLLDRFGRVQIAAARLVMGAQKYDHIPLVLHVLPVAYSKGAIGLCPLRPKKSVFDKRKNRKTWLAPLFIYLNNSSKHSNVDKN